MEKHKLKVNIPDEAVLAINNLWKNAFKSEVIYVPKLQDVLNAIYQPDSNE